MVETWDSLYHVISKAIYAEAARWGDYRRDVHKYQSKGKLYTVDDYYMKERHRLLTDYFPYRTAVVLADIRRLVPSGIHQHPSPTTQHPIYNLQGQQVLHPSKGIYIRDGKKVVVNTNE